MELNQAGSRKPEVGSPRRAFGWAAYGSCLCAIVYGAMKVYYATQGRLGLPGGPEVSDEAYQRYEHVVLRQLALVTVDVAAALVALATVQSWGRRMPRPLLLIAIWLAFVMLATGAVAVVSNLLVNPGQLTTARVLLAVFVIVWAALWGIMAWSYQRAGQ